MPLCVVQKTKQGKHGTLLISRRRHRRLWGGEGERGGGTMAGAAGEIPRVHLGCAGLRRRRGKEAAGLLADSVFAMPNKHLQRNERGLPTYFQLL